MARSVLLAAAALAAALATAPRAARAQDRDPWVAPDKARHFALSANLAAGGFVLGTGLWRAAPPRLGLGAALSLGAGVGKELLDLARGGEVSGRDLAWDAAGTVVGLLAAWLLDAALAPLRRPRALASGGAAAETPGPR